MLTYEITWRKAESRKEENSLPQPRKSRMKALNSRLNLKGDFSLPYLS